MSGGELPNDFRKSKFLAFYVRVQGRRSSARMNINAMAKKRKRRTRPAERTEISPNMLAKVQDASRMKTAVTRLPSVGNNQFPETGSRQTRLIFLSVLSVLDILHPSLGGVI